MPSFNGIKCKLQVADVKACASTVRRHLIDGAQCQFEEAHASSLQACEIWAVMGQNLRLLTYWARFRCFGLRFESFEVFSSS